MCLSTAYEVGPSGEKMPEEYLPRHEDCSACDIG